MHCRKFENQRRTPLAGSGPAFALLLLVLLVRQGASAASPEERFHAPDEQLPRLIDVLLAENPRLESASARSEAVALRAPQARSLPDPMMSYRFYAQAPETRVGPQEHMFEFSQSIPWGGKRRLEAERAERTASGLAWEVTDLEQRLVAALKRAYFEAGYLQEALAVNLEERELLRRFESIALRRYATGQGIQQNVVKVQTDLSRLEDQRTALERRLDFSQKRIAELIGRPEETLILGPVELRLPEGVQTLPDLEQNATRAHPRVRAVEQRIDADQAWEQSRELGSRPDFRVGLGYTLVGDREDPAGVAAPPPDNGQDILALSVGVKIPMYRKRIRAGVAEAQESRRAHERSLEAVRDDLRFGIRDASAQLESLIERGRLYREVIIPQAEESLASAEAAYSTDRLGFLDLLDAERILFQSRLAYHRLVADCWITMADLEESAARPVRPADRVSSLEETKRGSMP